MSTPLGRALIVLAVVLAVLAAGAATKLYIYFGAAMGWW